MNPRTLLNTGAGIVILGLLGAIWAALHFHAQFSSLHGPTAIAVGDGHVVVARMGVIDVLDGEGSLLASHDTEALGISPIQADLALLPGGLLLVANGSDGTPAACDLGSSRCHKFLQGTDTGGPVKFAIDDAGVWVVDSNNHRLLRSGLDGSDVTVVPVGELAFPNGIVMTGDALLLCDTNHSRVLRFPLAAGVPGEPQILIDDFDLAGGLRIRPTSIAPNPAGWWLLVADLNMVDAVLVRHAPDGSSLAEIPLPEAADPAALRAWQGGALVADTNGFQVLAVAGDGTVNAFGDAGYRALLADTRALHDSGQTGYYASLVALGIFLLAALGVALVEQRLKAGATPTAVQTGGVTWLHGPRVPSLRARIILVSAPLAILSLPLVLLALTLFSPLVALLLLMLPWLAVAFLFQLRARRVQRTPDSIAGLGVTQSTLVVRQGDGSERRYDLRTTPWSGRALHLPDRLLLLRDAEGWLYPEQQIRELLLPRLARRSRLGLG